MPNSKSSFSSPKANSGTLKIVKKIQSNFRNRQKKTQKASTTIQKQFRKKNLTNLTFKLISAQKKMHSNSRKIAELDNEIETKRNYQKKLMAKKKGESKTGKDILNEEISTIADEIKSLREINKKLKTNHKEQLEVFSHAESELLKEKTRQKTLRQQRIKETIEEEKLRDMHNLLKSYLTKLTDLYNEKAKIDKNDIDSNQKIKTINKKVYDITIENKYINAYNKINSSKYSEIISQLEDIKNKIHELYKKDAVTSKQVQNKLVTTQLVHEPLSVARFIESLKQCILNKSGGPSALSIERFNLLQFELTAKDKYKDGTKYFILKFNPAAFGIDPKNVEAHLTIVDNDDLNTKGTHISIKTLDTHGNPREEYRKYRNLSVNHPNVLWPRRLVPGMKVSDYKALLELMRAVNSCLASGKELDRERIEVFNIAYGKKKKLIKKKKLTKKKRKLYRKK